jgi:peptidoglycan/xylan/chitin deacetylase (PgdA/CDA1 family)
MAIACVASAAFANETSTVKSNPQIEPAAGHSHDEENQAIRKHHMKRLDDRLTLDPAELHKTCKYESDISTPPPKNRVVLSFDDGPEPGQTEHILATLKKYSIPAAFFMIGKKVQQHPELLAMVLAEKHQVIGSHSWDHPNFHDLSVAQQADEVLRSEPLLISDSQPKLFRYPYGNSSCETNQLLRSRGYRIVGWHVDSCDWAFDKAGVVDDKEAIVCGVLSQYHHDFVGHVVSTVRARKGGIILLHEIHPNTLSKLEEIITTLIAEGFSFGSVLEEGFQPSLR